MYSLLDGHEWANKLNGHRFAFIYICIAPGMRTHEIHKISWSPVVFSCRKKNMADLG